MLRSLRIEGIDPGSTGIVVKVATMQRAYRSEILHRQFGDRCAKAYISASMRRRTACFTNCSASVPALLASCASCASSSGVKRTSIVPNYEIIGYGAMGLDMRRERRVPSQRHRQGQKRKNAQPGQWLLLSLRPYTKGEPVVFWIVLWVLYFQLSIYAVYV
jgi:hypothetical protein